MRRAGDRLRRGLCVRVGSRVGARWGGVTHSPRSGELWEKSFTLCGPRSARTTDETKSFFTGLFHLEKLQWESTGTCLRKLFWGMHRFVRIYAQTWCQKNNACISTAWNEISPWKKPTQHNFSQRTAINKTHQSNGHTWATQQCRQLWAVGCCPRLLPTRGPRVAKQTRAQVAWPRSSCDPAKNPREKLPGTDGQTLSSLQQWTWELAGRKKWAAALFWICSWKQRGHVGCLSAWASYPNSASKQTGKIWSMPKIWQMVQNISPKMYTGRRYS